LAVLHPDKRRAGAVEHDTIETLLATLTAVLRGRLAQGRYMRAEVRLG
jgi:hypothetical protein